MAYFRSLGRATQSALVMTYIILFYISYSLLASFISTLTSLGTDKSFKTFRTVKMVRSNSGNMFKVLCESTSGQWNNKDIQEVLGSLEDTID
uniref:Uncharacterized protein n=1 Tax=Clytia hemisphaerica TaxID=252671 RepID=A0A7M5V995_9CNID